jgi:hypothetical protein
MTNGRRLLQEQLMNNLRLTESGEPLDLDEVVLQVLNIVSADPYFVYDGDIREVQAADWMDYEDNSTNYSLWVEAV